MQKNRRLKKGNRTFCALLMAGAGKFRSKARGCAVGRVKKKERSSSAERLVFSAPSPDLNG